MLKEKSYRDIAGIYDIVELEGQGETRLTNALIARHLSGNGAHRVLDMACGTGAQALALHREGFKVMASDLNGAMLEVARSKASGLPVEFHEADMVDVDLGTFDAIIAINNAVGHLTPDRFAQALRNASAHLTRGGLLIFDIFDAPMMVHMPTRPMIDVAVSRGVDKYVRYSSFAFDPASGVLGIRQTTHVQSGFEPFATIDEHYQLQTYERPALDRLVRENGFARASITAEGMPELHCDSGLSNFVVCHK